MNEFLVLGYTSYDFYDEDKGKRVAGVNVIYCDQPEDDDNRKGYVPMTVRAEIDMLDKFAIVPGFYQMFFNQKTNKVGGKASLVLAHAEFRNPVGFTTEV